MNEMELRKKMLEELMEKMDGRMGSRIAPMEAQTSDKEMGGRDMRRMLGAQMTEKEASMMDMGEGEEEDEMSRRLKRSAGR